MGNRTFYWDGLNTSNSTFIFIDNKVFGFPVALSFVKINCTTAIGRKAKGIQIGLVPRHVLADLRATGIFNSALGVMGRAKRKARLADFDFKMVDSNLCKPRGKTKSHLQCS